METQIIEKIVIDNSLTLEHLPIDGYEQVVKVTDKDSGLLAIIAIHTTTLGPALGGIRIQPYARFEDALEDVLRLAKGMTYKSALVEVGLGGGKAVVIADPKTEKTPALLRALGRAIDHLGGDYICAEDVGCTTDDVEIVRQTTKYVVGLANSKSSGDPGPFTAWGTFRGIQATLMQLYGSDNVEGRTIAVQGLGNVGMTLTEYLFWAGAKLILSDIDQVKLEKAAAKYGARTVPSDQILFVECDVLSPCALGGIFDDSSIPKLRCKAIAGAANNQLLRPEHGNLLRKRGIPYAPDFVINVGGILNVAAELEEEGYHPTSSRPKVHKIYDTITAIFQIAERNNESTHAAAISLADYRIKYGLGKRALPPTFHHTTD